MSPMPTAQYEQYLNDLVRRRRREGVYLEDQIPDRDRADVGGTARIVPDADERSTSAAEPDPRLLEKDWRTWFARAHCGWARRYAPWLLKDESDG